MHLPVFPGIAYGIYLCSLWLLALPSYFSMVIPSYPPTIVGLYPIYDTIAHIILLIPTLTALYYIYIPYIPYISVYQHTSCYTLYTYFNMIHVNPIIPTEHEVCYPHSSSLSLYIH